MPKAVSEMTKGLKYAILKANLRDCGPQDNKRDSL